MNREMFEHGQLPGSLELAFIGDTLWDLMVRTRLVKKGGSMKQLNRSATQHVCAKAQSEALARIEPLLTDEENDIVKRARNAHQNPTKNADPADYHRATALEALMGFLYLSGEEERMRELMKAALPEDEEKK